MKIIIDINGHKYLKDCTELGCANPNICNCEDGCAGFVPRNEKLKWKYFYKQLEIDTEDFGDDETINWGGEELGNNGEELKDYPDEDYGCDLQHENAERDCGAR